MLFRDMVQLASHMLPALRHGLRAASLEEQMTEGNLFVKMNKGFFTPQGIDYEELQVSAGPVAPVAFTRAEVDERMVLHAEFEKNPLHVRASGDDEVFLYAYCPQLQRGVLSAPVYRRSKRLSLSLPDEFAGLDVHFYAFVENDRQQASETMYLDLKEDSETTEGDRQDAGVPYYSALTVSPLPPQGIVSTVSSSGTSAAIP